VYLEAPSPAEDKIAKRYANILINDFTMTLWRIIITEDLHGTHNLDTWCVCRNNNDALLCVCIGVVRVVLAKNQVELTAGIASAANPPFMAVDNNFVTFLADRSTNIGRIRGGDWVIYSAQLRSLFREQAYQSVLS
jgi:hypothetical protein